MQRSDWFLIALLALALGTLAGLNGWQLWRKRMSTALPPAIKVEESGQTVPNGTPTSATFTTVDWDMDPPDNWFDSTNPTYLTCIVSGTYTVKVSTSWQKPTAGGGPFKITLNKNGTQITQVAQQYPQNFDSPAFQLVDDFALTVGDKLSVVLYEDTGGDLTANCSLSVK